MRSLATLIQSVAVLRNNQKSSIEVFIMKTFIITFNIVIIVNLIRNSPAVKKCCEIQGSSQEMAVMNGK